jgi:hypothetical protein
MNSDLWDLERRFWLDGAAFYADHLAPDALLVLPAPAGVLDHAATIASLRDAPRWSALAMDARRELALASDTVALVYRAMARRGDGTPDYHADCSSVYVRGGGGWRLALHQQTPLHQANHAT